MERVDYQFAAAERRGGSLPKAAFAYLRILAYAVGRAGALRVASVREVFLRQIYFCGVEALGKMAVFALLMSWAILTQFSNIFGYNAQLVGEIMVWTMIRELGPLFTAILLVSRSGTAIASELASMKINGEFNMLRLSGINPIDYLLVPRAAGMIATTALLTVYLQAVAIAGGIIIAVAFLDISLGRYLDGILGALSLTDVAVSISKSLIFGAITAGASIYHGFEVSSSITEIPQATIRAVMRSLFLVFLADGLITYAVYL